MCWLPSIYVVKLYEVIVIFFVFLYTNVFHYWVTLVVTKQICWKSLFEKKKILINTEFQSNFGKLWLGDL